MTLANFTKYYHTKFQDYTEWH